MATDTPYRWTPDVPVAPGETLREILEERSITQTELALRLNRSEKFVSQLVNGKAPLAYRTAIALERVLGVPASFWNAAEAQYRDALARQRQQAEAEVSPDAGRPAPLKPFDREVMRVVEYTRVGKRGTVVIPADTRQRLGIDEGELLVLEETAAGILLRPTRAYEVEVYTPERSAEFLLNNAVTAAEYDAALAEVRAMGLDPDTILHQPRPGA